MFKKGKSDLITTVHEKLLKGGQPGQVFTIIENGEYPEWSTQVSDAVAIEPLLLDIDALQEDVAAHELIDIDLQAQITANNLVDTNLSSTVNDVLAPSVSANSGLLNGGTTGYLLTGVTGGLAVWQSPGDLTGAEGPQGPAGPVGPQGDPGPAGDDGAPGIQGADGPVGPAGTDGADGLGGLNGVDGVDGSDGTAVLSGSVPPVAGDGIDGDFWIDTATSLLYGPKAVGTWPGSPVSLVGPPGATGADGAAGADGLDGADSTVPGPQGAQGIQGAMGLPGDPGADSTVPGPQGIQGPAGADGADGADGDPVTPISTSTGTDLAILATHGQTMVETDNAAANTVTIPLNATEAIPVNTRVDIMQIGTGATTIAVEVGVTLHPQHASTLELAGQWAACSIIKRGTDEWSTVGRFVQS